MSRARPADAVAGGSLATAASGAARGQRSTSPLRDAANATIVLADDRTVVRRGLRMLLEEAGFTIPAEAADTPQGAAQDPCL